MQDAAETRARSTPREIEPRSGAASARPARRRRRWLLALLAGAVVSLALHAQRREQPADLISISGCEDLRRESADRYSCAMEDSATPADAAVPRRLPRIGIRLRAPAGRLLLPVDDPRVTLRRDGAQFELTWRATPQPLRWHVFEVGWHGWTRHGFELQAIAPGSDAAHVLALRKTEGAHSAGREAVLRQRLQAARSDGERAILGNELGYQLYSQGRMPEAERELALALPLAQASGWISVAANSARILAGLRFREHGDVYAAEKLLHEHAPLIRLHAIENASMLFERAIHAAARGEIRLAQTYYREAFAEAKRVDYPDLRRYIEASHAALLWKSGEHRKAAEQAAELRTELSSLAPADFESPCTRALQLDRLASAEVMAVESGQGHAEQTLTALSVALKYADSDGCKDTVLRANLYAHRARVALLLAEAAAAQPWPTTATHPAPHTAAASPPPWVSAAEADLAQARKEHSQPSSVRDLEYAELSGRLASLRGESDVAIDRLQQAEQQAFALVDADARFRVLTALAVAHARKAAAAQDAVQAEQHRQQARAKFDAAEAQLDERVFLVPLDVARRGFLPRYEPGIALYLRFLLDHGSAHDALALMRRTQARGLALAIHAARLTSGADGSSPDGSHDAQELVQLYLQRQRKLDKGSAEDPQQQAQERQRIRTLLAGLQPPGHSRLPLRPLRAGEAMLICHVLPAEQILCMTADAQAQIAQVVIGRTDLDLALTSIDAPRRVSRLLLPALLPIVQPARVLRVIPSALLRLIDFASLPHPTQPTLLLHSQRAVVYALDIDPSALQTQRPAAPPSGPDATLVVHGGIAKSESVPPLIQRMQALGWDVSPHAEGVMSMGAAPLRRLQCWLGLVDSCRHPLLPPEMPTSTLRPGDAKTVLASLDGSRLAHFFTHAAYNSADGGWQSAIVMPDHSTLHASALMGLRQAPRFAVLITCEGGQSGVGTEPEDISLAQVFLLRGGQAVAASRYTLDARIGATWAQALYEAEPVTPWAPGPLMSAQSPDLGAAFHAAQHRLLSQEPTTVSWQALRLYVL